MNYIEILQQNLDAGYSKSQLEYFMGLPRNSLSSILKGAKSLSKKSRLKIEIWEASKKPSPLQKIPRVNVPKNTKLTKEIKNISASLKEAKQEMQIMNDTPKNLEQLRQLCPDHLTGFDRSEWMRENRMKYNI